MIKIDSQESLIFEYQALINQINKSIAELAQYQQTEREEPAVTLTEKLNRLKYHRKKLENGLKQAHHWTMADWLKVRKQVRETFEKAHNEWMSASEDLKNPGDVSDDSKK